MKRMVSFSCFPTPSLPAHTQREDYAKLCVLLWHYCCLSLAPQSFPGPVKGSAGVPTLLETLTLGHGRMCPTPGQSWPCRGNAAISSLT